MLKNTLLKTNILVCLFIIIGFSVVALIDYRSSRNQLTNNIEQISASISDAIYYRLEAVFAKPVSTSLTMATSSLLKNSLASEADLEDDGYTQMLREYLNTYKEEYNFESVFLVSAKTRRYYNYNGVDRVIEKDNPENDWYFSFLESGEDYRLNVDNDEAARDEITVFVNCRIKGNDGKALGVVGVGLRFDELKGLLKNYANEYNTEIYLISTDGDIEIAVDNSGFLPIDFFSICGYPQLKDEILTNKTETLAWWLTEQDERNLCLTRFIPALNWHLIVEHNTSLYDAQTDWQLSRAVLTTFVTGLLVLTAITYTISRFNKQIAALTVSIEQEKQAAFRSATEQLYDNIYELNITKNRAMGRHTQQYFKNLGMDPDTPYDEALKIIAEKDIKEEYQKDYIFTFSPENVLHEYSMGNTNIKCELLSRAGGATYYWLRIMAHIYYRNEDKSVCMFTYRKNIDEEKRQEEQLSEQLLREVELTHMIDMHEKELLETRINAMLGQIQPHFLFNSLAAIQDLCQQENAVESENTVKKFSKYLRGNLDALTNKHTIAFSKELEHTQIYLFLEQKRFEERLNVVFDIQATDFNIPAMSLQTMVENAVRHGVAKREEGGTVTIRTAEDEKRRIVIVEDDGVGFLQDSPAEDNRTHIGIKNTRERLKIMCGGTLEINSTLGIGTVVTIIIPKGGMET